MGTLLVAVAFFGLRALGMPVGFSIGVAGVIGILDMGPRFLNMAPDRVFAGLELFALLAMPFFILAGEIMNRWGITEGPVRLANALVGWMRGGVAHSNMVASVTFAGITGAATADAAAFGNTLVPAMEKAGYKRAYAAAVTAAGSIIGPTIPPSTLAIIFGSIMAAAIAGAYALFVGGVIYRALTWRDLYEIAVRATRITGAIFQIIASASILGWWMTFNRIPQEIAGSKCSSSPTVSSARTTR